MAYTIAGTDLTGIEQKDPTYTVAGTETIPSTTSTITSDILTPQTDLSTQIRQPESTPIYPVSGLDSTISQPTTNDLQLTEEEKRIQQILKEQSTLQNELVGQSAYQAEQEKVQGLPELYKTQTELSSRLKTLQNEALAIPLQLQQESIARGITRGGLQPIQTAALRNNAIQALSTSSLLEASKGNIALAQNLVERAVAQKFNPIREQLAAKEANIALLLKDPAFSLADKNRARKQQEQINAQRRELEKQEIDEKEIKSTLNLAIKYGLQNTQLMDKISKARSPLEALQLAAPYLQDPKAKYELEEARLNNILKREQIATAQQKRLQIGTLTPKEIAKNLSKQQQAEAAVDSLSEKRRLIEEALKASGMGTRVGTSIFTRTPQGFWGTVGKIATGIGILGLIKDAKQKLTGEGQAFSGTVQQLTSTETLNKLIEAKANGATFGALSDSELNLLISSASKIGKWEMRDERGNPLGIWNIDETSFKNELNNLLRLTDKALLKAGGDSISIEDKNIIDELWSGGTSSTMEGFNPADY